MVNTEIVVRQPAFGEVTVRSGTPHVNATHATITQSGYRTRISIRLNYNIFDPDEVATVEAAVTATMAEAFARAAELRDRNQPLFGM